MNSSSVLEIKTEELFKWRIRNGLGEEECAWRDGISPEMTESMQCLMK